MTSIAEQQAASQTSFEQNVDGLTLRFKNKTLEAEYHVRKAKVLAMSRVFRYGCIVLFSVVVFRRLELLTLGLCSVPTISVNVNSEYLQVGLMIAAIILESLAVKITFLNIFKGLPAMVYVFFMVFSTSASYLPAKPASVPMYVYEALTFISGIPTYIGTVVLGAVYVYSWVVGAIGMIVGMAISIIYTHMYNFPICTGLCNTCR
jgi:hypothetical protein